ncbi:hypothetical protein B0H17DRAFT_1203182 [Mycena rosella]|uniref:Glycosyltransferase family 1 protein n=1 Tax=Mycena rosella TaxID=1033263 RepID=A0AAD7DFD7_MYCRO|nr:hypothetical protein B0H17DRAFT_1203182 [Mycena rosella]
MATHHIVTLMVPSWGHVSSYIHLATQLLQNDSVLVITMVQHNLMVAKMEAEMQTCDYDAARLRIIGVGEKEAAPTIKDAFGQLIGGWLGTVAQLTHGSEGWPKPHTIHLDSFVGGFVIEPTKKILGPDCKMLLLSSCSLSSLPAMLTDHDITAIAENIYADDACRAGRSKDEILAAIVAAGNGTDKLSGIIVKFPGLPDMYDHECIGCGAGTVPGIAPVLASAYTLAKAVDGIITTSSACIEPGAVEYCRALFDKRGQELFTVGLQAHELCWGDAAPVPPTNDEVRAFLDTVASQNGPKSVLYISFGSAFFPVATPELVEGLVTTLLALEPPFPFLFALGSRMATLPKALIERANASGRGLICEDWVEQRAVLQHAAVGWFLTHGGWNSVSEALSQGIPLIVWPTAGDQTTNAALLSSGAHPVALELMQVRTGAQLGPSLRTTAPVTGTVEAAAAELTAAFGAARGPLGATLRENAEKMARSLREARKGDVGKEIRRLARF